eukprot:scaffold61932_cov36-Phaeocystis_antarctica.AAC.1
MAFGSHALNRRKSRQMTPLEGANLGVVRALWSAVLAPYVYNLDGSERFGLGMYPHVKILSKFEARGGGSRTPAR